MASIRLHPSRMLKCSEFCLDEKSLEITYQYECKNVSIVASNNNNLFAFQVSITGAIGPHTKHL